MRDLKKRSNNSNSSKTIKSSDKSEEQLDKSHEVPPILAPKYKQTCFIALVCLLPYLYFVFFQYKIETQLKKSILINMVMSVFAFSATVMGVPVASRYVLRRNMFGYDINKKGSPQGTIKVPESLGVVVGIVFLVVMILFQHFNYTADSTELGLLWMTNVLAMVEDL